MENLSYKNNYIYQELLKLINKTDEIYNTSDSINLFKSDIQTNKWYNIFKSVIDLYYVINNIIYKKMDLTILINQYGLTYLYSQFEYDITKLLKTKDNIKYKTEIVLLINKIFTKFKSRFLELYINTFDVIVFYIYENKIDDSVEVIKINNIDITINKPNKLATDYKIKLLTQTKLIELFSLHLFLTYKKFGGYDENSLETYRKAIELEFLEKQEKNNEFKLFINNNYNVNKLTLFSSNQLEEGLSFTNIVSSQLKKYDYSYDVSIYPDTKIQLDNFSLNFFIYWKDTLNTVIKKRKKFIGFESEIDDLFDYYILIELLTINKPMYKELIYYYYYNPEDLLNYFDYSTKTNSDEIIKYKEKEYDIYFTNLYNKLNSPKLDIIKIIPYNNNLTCIHIKIADYLAKNNSYTFVNLLYSYLDNNLVCKSCFDKVSINISSSDSIVVQTDLSSYKILSKFIEQSHSYIKTLGRIFNIDFIIYDDLNSTNNRSTIIKLAIELLNFIKKNENSIRKTINLAKLFFVFSLDNNIYLNVSSNIASLIDQYLIQKQNNLFIVLSIITVSIFNTNINKYLTEPIINISNKIFFQSLNITNTNLKYYANIGLISILYKYWKINDTKASLVDRIKKYYYEITEVIATYINIIFKFKNNNSDLKILFNLISKKMQQKNDIVSISKNYTLFLQKLDTNNLKIIINKRSLILFITDKHISSPQKDFFYDYKKIIKEKVYKTITNEKEYNIIPLSFDNDIIQSKNIKYNKEVIYNDFITIPIFIRYNIDTVTNNNVIYSFIVESNEEYKNLLNEMFNKFFKIKKESDFINSFYIFNQQVLKIIFNKYDIEVKTASKNINFQYLKNKDSSYVNKNIIYFNDLKITLLANEQMSVLNLSTIGYLFLSKIYTKKSFFTFVKNIIRNAIIKLIKPGTRTLINKLMKILNVIVDFNINFNPKPNIGILIVINDPITSIFNNDVDYFINIFLSYFILLKNFSIEYKFDINQLFEIISDNIINIIEENKKQKIAFIL